MSKNIHAFTETTAPNYPGYISINEDDDGKLTVTLRNRGNNVASVIKMSPEELEAMGRNIVAHFTPAIQVAGEVTTKSKKK